jgi:hypothetical protein
MLFALSLLLLPAARAEVQIKDFRIVDLPFSHSVEVRWNTSVPVECTLYFGTEREHLDQELTEPKADTAHKQVVMLHDTSAYFFQVVAVEESGVKTSSLILDRPAKEAPEAPKGKEWSVVDFRGTPDLRTANLSWSTPGMPTTAVLRWGPTLYDLSRRKELINAEESQTAHVDGLEPDTDYWFVVDATAKSGSMRPAPIKLHTLPETAPAPRKP